MNLNLNDAQTLLTTISVILIPFIIAWLPTLKVNDYVKFSILVILSLIGGGLTAYVSGQLSSEGTIIQHAAVIATAAQIFYYAAFRKLGLERVLFPQQAVINQAKQDVKEQLVSITPTQAADILNKDNSASVTVTTNVQG